MLRSQNSLGSQKILDLKIFKRSLDNSVDNVGNDANVGNVGNVGNVDNIEKILMLPL